MGGRYSILGRATFGKGAIGHGEGNNFGSDPDLVHCAGGRFARIEWGAACRPFIDAGRL